MGVHVPVGVVLDISRTTSTISGQLAVDGAPASRFYGWLELIDALERVASAGAPQRDAVDGDSEPRER